MEFKTYKCKLKTISPVFIGAGSEYHYGPNEYIQSKAKLNDNTVKIIRRINITDYYKQLDDDKKDEFLSNITEPDFELEQLNDKTVNKYETYKSVQQCKHTPKDIQEHIKTLNKLYIPGSSIKGAIETAILYDNITDNNIKEIENLIRKNKRGNYYIDRKYTDFINNFFANKKSRNKAQENIMKFLQITDTTTTKLPFIYDVETIQATSKYNYNYHQMHGNTVYSHLETIRANIKLQCELTTKNDTKILEKLNLLDKKQFIDIDYIKEVLYNFSQDYIEYEIEYSDKYNMDFLTKFYEKLSKMNTYEKPLMKIGAGSGFMATTINMKVKEKNPVLFDKIRQISHHSYIYEYPKSRKITCMTKKPLGWIQMMFTEK